MRSSQISRHLRMFAAVMLFQCPWLAVAPVGAADPDAGPPFAAFRDDEAGGKFGFIDRMGHVVIEPKFDYASDFAEGLAEAWLGDQRGFIDASGKFKFTLPPGTDAATDVSEGRIWFRREKDDKWGLCDGLGNVILEPQYDDVEPFSEGLAAVNLGRKVLIPVEFETGKWGFVNKQGELILPVKLDFVGSFSEGLARVSDAPGTRFIDVTGKTAFTLPRASHVGDFREGLAPIHIDRSLDGEGWLTNFIDRRGQTKLTVDGWAEEFHEGLAVIVVRGGDAESNEHKSYGFIDKTGTVVVPPRFGEAYAFHEGLAAVRTKKTTVYGMGDSWGYIDKTGKYRIEPFCNEAGSFRDGIARVHVGGKLREVYHAPPYWEAGEWLLIDPSGKKLRSWNAAR